MKLPEYMKLKIFYVQYPLCWSVYITTRGKHDWKIGLAAVATRREARQYAKDVRTALSSVNNPLKGKPAARSVFPWREVVPEGSTYENSKKKVEGE
jgi:hypothetical protein